MTVIAQSLRNGTRFPRRRRDIRGVTARMSAGIALLAAGFGVKRCLVGDDGDLAPGIIGLGTVRDKRGDLALGTF